MATSTIPYRIEGTIVSKTIPAGGTLTINNTGYFVAIITTRASLAAGHGAWLVSGYSNLQGSRCTVTALETAAGCSIAVTADSTITVTNSAGQAMACSILPFMTSAFTVA